MTRPACENYDPEMWYPETKKQNNKRDMQEVKEAMAKGVEALKICATCPLMANGWCFNDTFSSLDSVRYGISAGLLPNEKRKMIDYFMSDISEPFWVAIRNKATEQGVAIPLQPKREKPRQFYLINDKEISKQRSAE